MVLQLLKKKIKFRLSLCQYSLPEIIFPQKQIKKLLASLNLLSPSMKYNSFNVINPEEYFFFVLLLTFFNMKSILIMIKLYILLIKSDLKTSTQQITYGSTMTSISCT